MMADELPILKGILNGVVDYHNARECHLPLCHLFHPSTCSFDLSTCSTDLLTCPFLFCYSRPVRARAQTRKGQDPRSHAAEQQFAIAREGRLG